MFALSRLETRYNIEKLVQQGQRLSRREGTYATLLACHRKCGRDSAGRQLKDALNLRGSSSCGHLEFEVVVGA